MPYILRRFDYATTYNTCMYLWPVAFALFPFLNALAHPPAHSETVPGTGSETTAKIGIWIGLALVLGLSKVAAIPYSITMLLIKRHAPGWSGTGPTTATTTGTGSALGRSNGLVQLAMCLGRAVGPVVVSAVFTTLNGSTWARRWGVGWVWSVVMVCFAVVGARVTKGIR